MNVQAQVLSGSQDIFFVVFDMSLHTKTAVRTHKIYAALTFHARFLSAGFIRPVKDD